MLVLYYDLVSYAFGLCCTIYTMDCCFVKGFKNLFLASFATVFSHIHSDMLYLWTIYQLFCEWQNYSSIKVVHTMFYIDFFPSLIEF